MASKRPWSRAEDDPAPRQEVAESAPTSKKKRPGVTARRAANADTDVSVVNTTFNSFCTDQAKALPWESVLMDMNKAVLEAYVLANVHVVQLCRLRRAIKLLDQSFFHRCLSIISNPRHLSSDDVQESIALYNEWRGADVGRPRSDLIARGGQDNAAQQMETNAQNAVKVNFYRRFHKQIKRCYDMNGREAYAMLKTILDSDYDGDDDEVLAWRERIPQKPSGWLDAQVHLLLPLTCMFLSDIKEWSRRDEATPDFKTIRSFSLLPFKKGFECSHFTMCNRGLRALLRRVDIAVLRETEWTPVADRWWRRLFNISKFETVNRKFAGQILTDGKAVSTVMRKPKREAVERPLDEKDYDVMWGLDPGRRDLFVATSQFGAKIRCSTRKFYEDVHYKKNNQKVAVWQENHLDVLEAIRNMPTKKTASLDRLEEYVRFMTPRMDLVEFCMAKPFHKLKLRRYILAKKKLRALCMKLTEQAGRRTVVGFGDWSNKDSSGLIKRCPAGPVKRLEHELKNTAEWCPLTSSGPTNCTRCLMARCVTSTVFACAGMASSVPSKFTVYSIVDPMTVTV